MDKNVVVQALMPSSRLAPDRLLNGAFAAFGIFWGAWGAMLPAIKSTLDASDAELGRALLFIALGALSGMFSIGKVTDRIGSAILFPALAAFALLSVPPVFARNLVVFTIMLVLLGVATGAVDVVLNAGAASFERVSGKRLMGGAHASFSFGLLVGGLGGGIARDAGAEPEEVMIVVAAVMLVSAAACRSIFLPPPEPITGMARKPGATLSLIGGVCALAFLIEDGMVSWSAVHLEETLGARPVIGGVGPAVLAAFMICGRLLYQRLGTRLPDRATVVIAGPTAGAGILLVAAAPSPWVALTGIGICGAALAVCAPILIGLAGVIGADRGGRGAAIGHVTSIAYMGFILGPPLVGGVAGVAGLPAGIAVMGLVALVLGAGALRLPNRTT